MTLTTPTPAPIARHRRPLTRQIAIAVSCAFAIGIAIATPTASLAAPLPEDGTTDGIVHVGINGDGGVGNGTTYASETEVPAAAKYAGTPMSGKTITSLAANGDTQIALTTDGEILSWGQGGTGQLGDGTTTSAQPLARPIDLTGTPLEGKRVTDIALGNRTAYALASDGTLAAWGANDHGQLGDGSTERQTRPIAVDLSALGGAKIIGVFARTAGAVVQTTDGAVYGWGDNVGGVVEPGGPAAVLTPTLIDLSGTGLAGKTIAQMEWHLSGHGNGSVILTTDGEVFAWGHGRQGELGQDTLVSTLVKPAVIPAFDGVTITSVQMSTAGNALALTESGAVHTWGSGRYGGLGQGDDVSTGSPILLDLPTAAVAIESGYYTGFAVLDDGTVSAWGYPYFGTLGNGRGTTFQTPRTMPTAGTALDGRAVTGIRQTYHTTIMFTEPIARIEPIRIDSPVDGAIVDPGFAITGVGEPGSRVEVTEPDGTPVSSFEITEPDGSWSVQAAIHLPPATYTWTFTQQADGSTDTVTVTIRSAPVTSPVTITSPADGDMVDVRPMITGGGTPGAVITVSNGTTALGTAPVDEDGVWSLGATADLAAGEHTFTATQDVDASSASVTVMMPTPSAPSPAGAALASTGTDAALLFLLATLLVVAGGIATAHGVRARRAMR